jgi:ribose transport system ATP-binding protein
VVHQQSNRQAKEVVLDVRDLNVDRRLRDIDLTVKSGEIVAVYGLMGAGRTRLARTLFGLEKWASGEATMNGRAYAPRHAIEAIRSGVGFVGEDRSAGLVSRMTVAENIALGSLSTFEKAGTFNRRAARAVGQDYVDRLKIKTETVDTQVGALSGGNQQKVLLARWMCANVNLLILDDPARGVDVGAKEEIFAELLKMCDAGTAVIYFTSDADEARRLSDRILVMASGRIVAELLPSADEKSIMAAAGGAHV